MYSCAILVHIVSFVQALEPICPLSSRATSSHVQLPNCRYTLLLRHMSACCAAFCCHVVCRVAFAAQVLICHSGITSTDCSTTTCAHAGFAVLTLLFLILFLVSTLSASKGDTASGAGTSSDILSGGQAIDSTSAAGSLLLSFCVLAANLGIQSS